MNFRHNNLFNISSRYWIYLFILLILVVFTSRLMLSSHPFYYTKYMHLGYISSAENLFTIKPSPFSWRILQPFLVNLIPLDLKTSFFLLSFSALYFTSILVYKITLYQVKDVNLAFMGAVFFISIVWAVRFNIIEFWYPESLLYFFIVLAIYAIHKNNKILLATSLIFGVLTKETMISIFPLYYSIKVGNNLFKKFEKKIFVEMIIISLPAIAAITFLIVFITKDSVYSYAADWFNQVFVHRLSTLIGIKNSLKHNVIESQPWFLTISINWYRLSLGAFVGFFILTFLKWKETRHLIKEYAPLLIFSYLQLFIAYDIERLIVISFLPLILLTVSSISKLIKKNFLDIKYFWIYTILHICPK